MSVGEMKNPSKSYMTLDKVGSSIWRMQPSGPFRYVLPLFFARHAVLNEINNKKAILDVGCSKGEIIKSYRKMGLKSSAIGLDLHLPSLKKCLLTGAYAGVVCASATHLPFKVNSFNATLFLQAIEHLSTDLGWQALNECHRVSTKVIVTTPVGFVSQDTYDDNVFQIHLSGWAPKTMRKQGYRVRGFSGLALCWVEKGGAVLPGRLGAICVLILSLITQPIVFFFPRLGFQMLCVKEL